MDNNIFTNLEYENYLATWRMEYGCFTGDYLWDKSSDELINIFNSSFEETILTEKAYFREKKLRQILNK